MVDSPGGKNLYISSIFQKSLIEVNEGGTKTVATSVVRVALMCMPLYDKIDFVANHPRVHYKRRHDWIGDVHWSRSQSSCGLINTLNEKCASMLNVIVLKP